MGAGPGFRGASLLIAKVRGILDEVDAEGIVVDVGGVGYHLSVSSLTRQRLPQVGEPVSLYVHTHVREDAILLYGFHSPAERELFRQLLTVSGVGPRLALAILSVFPPEGFRDRVLRQDWQGLLRIPGVGKKTAQRLVVELRERIADSDPLLPAGDGAPAREEALAALVTLGYRRGEAARAVEQALAAGGPTDSTEVLLTRALRLLGKESG